MIYFFKYSLIFFLLGIPVLDFILENYFHIKDYIKYIVLVFITILLFQFLISFINKIKKIFKKENKKSKANLLDDNIFEDYPEQKVKALVKTIKFYTNEKFFSMALIGEWGSGKSSYLKKLETKIKDSNVVIYINLWKLGNQANIIKEIQTELDNKIFKSNIIIWASLFMEKIFIKNYFSILSKYYKVNKSLVDISLDKTIEDAKKSYNKKLKLAFGNKKLVIIFDELDRIDDTKEIFNIFNTIRYLTSFDNTIAITAVDLNQIEKKINNIEYIHKIFNMKYFIPVSTKNELKEYLKEKILNFKDYFHNDIDKILETNFENKTILDIIKNYREIKNSINETKIILQILNANYGNEWKKHITLEFIFIMNLIKAINFKEFNKIYQIESLKLTGNEDEEEFNEIYDTSDFLKIKDYSENIRIMIKILNELNKGFDLNYSLYIYKYYNIEKKENQNEEEEWQNY